MNHQENASHAPSSADSIASTNSSHPQPRIRRRNRMITSCLECRRRKLKCDKLQPCTNCTKYIRNCVFLAPALDSTAQMRLNEIKEKMGSLERVLEQDVAKKKARPHVKKHPPRRASVGLPGEDESDSDDEHHVPEDEKNLEPTPLAVVDAGYEDDGDDEMLDLGVKLGKMRMTERLGGFVRPKMSEEISFTLDGVSNDDRTVEKRASNFPSPSSAEAYLEPGPTYIAPGSGFIFGDVGKVTSFMEFLPSKIVADTLLQQYLKNVHSIAHILHWPSFQRRYEDFWTTVVMGIEPPASQPAIVFAVMFTAVASMTEEDAASSFSQPKRDVLITFQMGTEFALSKAQCLRTTKVETLQALVTYLIPMCRSEISRAHSVLVGTAIRLAECMGLHRDPAETYGLSPVDAHVRRMIWYQLCFLDIRTCESQGPRPGVRREDFDTKFPLNINDADLLSPVCTESTVFTDMTTTRIRFECNEMHRVIWVDRIRLEKKQANLVHVLAKIESFRKAMEAKYYPMLDEKVPLQRFTKLLMSVLLLRMHIIVLHRYHNSVNVRIPDRLRQIIITSGTQHLEAGVSLETLPELLPWRWYAGASQQWHTALLLLIEVFVYPMRKEADRIWRVIDYVFEPDLSLSRVMKARMILSDLRDRTAVYRNIRKIRAPISMSKRGLRKPLYGPREGTDAPLPTSIYSENSREGAALPATHSMTSQGVNQDRRDSNWCDHDGIYATSSDGYRNAPMCSANSPHQTADPTIHSWSFDAPATYLFKPPKDKSSPPNTAGSPSRDMVSSPSEGGTSDSWPPYINPGQQGWPGPTAQHPGFYHKPSREMSTAAAAEVAAMSSIPVPGVDLVVTDDVDAAMQSVSEVNNATSYKEDLMMVDIDWHEWDKIFPPEINTGVLNMPQGNDLDAV